MRGGICRQIRIVANTSSTVFLANIQDSSNVKVIDYGQQTGELNDITAIPMAGRYTIRITNASPDDTFTCYFGVEE